MNCRTFFAALLAMTLPLAGAASPAEAIYFGGPIVTLDDRRPVAEAVAVRHGTIVDVGTLEAVQRRFRGKKTRMVNLAGRALLPGFIETHGRLASIALGGQPPPSEREARFALVERAQDAYARNGYTTAQALRVERPLRGTLEGMAQSGRLKIDVVAYADGLAHDDPGPPYLSRSYADGFRIAGVGLALDGPGSTALSDEALTALLTKAFAKGWQVVARADGDAAVDQLLRAVRDVPARAAAAAPATERKLLRRSRAAVAVERRPVLVHAAPLRPDQLRALDELGILASISPAALDAAHVHGRTVTFAPTGEDPGDVPDPLAQIASAWSRTGHADPALEPLAAIRAQTLWAARQLFEEETKGSIAPGKVADLVVLSRDPVTAPQESLGTIRVIETIKRGKTIYRATEGS
jgi:predicted amidohydrolase YtcJ